MGGSAAASGSVEGGLVTSRILVSSVKADLICQKVRWIGTRKRIYKCCAQPRSRNPGFVGVRSPACTRQAQQNLIATFQPTLGDELRDRAIDLKTNLTIGVAQPDVGLGDDKGKRFADQTIGPDYCDLASHDARVLVGESRGELGDRGGDAVDEGLGTAGRRWRVHIHGVEKLSTDDAPNVACAGFVLRR
ncbi:hypothetical protein PoMZ_01966 [Pyricularia oryzae]|uniref:Uncharacterized protein n=1 Tax=Pyricularia oryzae TaxID=318829 RepID=A0A4P7N3J4_PYROR|nr:hypothetical protein PoMZ_01966 [Pyricularia oryzae]